MTYNDYLIKITETMKIRSTNYRLSQNDIIYLANNVYQELAMEIHLGFISQNVIIDQDTIVYDIGALYTTIGNETALDVISIRDDEGFDVSRYFREKDVYVFTVDRFTLESENDRFLKDQDGREITFVRRVIPDIETLDLRIQTLIFPAIIEGMLMYTHDSIPNPTANNSPAQETAQHYGMYEKQKLLLINQLPQRM